MKEKLKIERVNYDYHEIYSSRLETVLARGDRSLSKVILKAQENGCIFDSWTENFDYDKWMQAMDECGICVDDFINEIDINQTLPWEHLDIGISKEYLLKERELAYKATTTRDCRAGCTNCGMKQKGWCKR